MASALEFFERFVQLFEGFTLVDELRVVLVEHLLHRADLVDHHAEDGADGALAREVTVFGQFHLPAQQINQVFGVALIEHGKVALNT